MRRILIAMAAILSMQSCCHKLYPHTSEVTERKETVTEVLRDTVIMVQPDSSILQALVQCDSTGRARLQEINALKESARLQQTIKIDSDPEPHKPTVITIKTQVDSLGIYLIYKERYKETAEIQQIETVIEKEVNILKTWQKVLMWLGVLAILWILIKILLKIQISV